MSSILTCPACRGAFELPPGNIDQVDCPHCQATLSMHVEAAVVATARAAKDVSRLPVRSNPAAAPQPPRERPANQQHSAPSPRRPASKNQRPGLFGQMVGVIGGGCLGMVVGYYLLNFFGGPRYNFLQVALPYVAHTQPGWVDPANEPAVPVAASAEPAPIEQAPAELPVSAPLPVKDDSPPENVQPVPAQRTFEFPVYGAAELDSAKRAAQYALGCKQCLSSGTVKRMESSSELVNGKLVEKKEVKESPCPACGGKPTPKITQDVYSKLCHLAQIVTFVDLPQEPEKLEESHQEIQAVFLRVAEDRDRLETLGRLAGECLTGTASRKNNGIVLAGTVEETGQAGDYHWSRIVLFGRPTVVQVISMGPPPYKSRSRVLIAGSLIDHPREKLAGFAGNEPLVVLGGLPLVLSEM